MRSTNHSRNNSPRTASRLRFWLDILSLITIIMGTIVTTLLGVLLQPDGWYWEWFPYTSGAIGLLVAFFVLRQCLDRQQRKRGTLYYIRFLDSSMSDVHASMLQRIKGKYLDLRTITRSYPPYDERREATDRAPEAIDVSSLVDECSHALEQAATSDVIDTQFTYAPNVLFPMGLSIGYQTYFTENTTFIELPAASSVKYGSWQLNITAGFADATVSPEIAMPYTLTWPISDITWQAPRQVRKGHPVLLRWHMTPNDTPPIELSNKWRIPADARGILGQGGDGCKIPAKESKETNERINAMAAACARSLWEVYQASPDSPIVLCAQLPKSLQLAVGWRLAQKLDKTSAQYEQWNPWERLITLQYSASGSTWSYSIVRVHPAQPSLDQMMTMLGFNTPTTDGAIPRPSFFDWIKGVCRIS